MDKLINTTLERELIGFCVRKPEASYLVTDQLTEDHFTSYKHKAIYTAIKCIQKEGYEPDVVNVKAKLNEGNKFDMIGYNDYYDMVDGAAINEQYHIAQLQKLHQARETYKAYYKAVKELEHGPDALDEITNDVNQAVTEASLTRKADKPQLLSDVVAECVAELEQRFEHGTAAGISTGFNNIDEYIQLCPGEFIVIQGRPGMCKTALSLQLAYKVAVAGSRVAFFTLEMSNQALVNRLISCVASVGNMRREVKDYQLQAVKNNVSKLDGVPLYLCDAPISDVNSIQSKVRMLQLQHGIDLVIIDYLQLIATKGKRPKDDGRVVEVGTISRELKLMSKQFKIPVIALSQMSRNCEYRTNKRPLLADLRESGSIEQDADIVLGLYRDEYYDDDSEDRGVTEVIVNKNRHGSSGTAYLCFYPEYLTFTDKEAVVITN